MERYVVTTSTVEETVLYAKSKEDALDKFHVNYIAKTRKAQIDGVKKDRE